MRLGALRIVLGAAPVCLAMAGDDCAGVKTGGATGVSMTAISNTVNISVGAAAAGAAEGAAQGVDPAAGRKGQTEYEGKPQGTCRFIERDGVRRDVVCE